ncbi:MAG: FKBP-type peptidyl-prolyl cis-trans isomerase [Thermodesulfobacteriota bacterium]|nr:FKBP-type peptidyl-prolyl cis-trans isomerase [Thermodesulfobacteriota bacterium]
MKKMRRWSVVLLMMISLIACSSDTDTSPAGPESELDTVEKQFSYTMGYEVILTLQELKSVELDKTAFLDGIHDAMETGKSALAPQRMVKIKSIVSAKERSLRNKETSRVAKQNLEKQEAFLAENKKKQGVKTTESGLQYKILKKGDGRQPDITDNVRINFEGRLLNGTVFDTTQGRGGPALVKVKGTIPAWEEALRLMREGAKYRFFVPSELAHGKIGTVPDGGIIGPNQMIIMDIELLEIVEKSTQSKQPSGQQQGQAEPVAPDSPDSPDSPETDDAQ